MQDFARPRELRAASRAARNSETSENVGFVNGTHKPSARASRSLFYKGSAEGGHADASDQGDGPLSPTSSERQGCNPETAFVADALDVKVGGEPSPLKQALLSQGKQIRVAELV